MFNLKKIWNKFTKSEDPGVRRIFIFGKKAGVRVDHDSALTYSAVWRAINYISQTIATLPWYVIERETTADGRSKRTVHHDHRITYLLNVQPNDEMNAKTFRETIIAHALSWGNGYAEIERDMGGRPVALWPIEPDRVTPKRDTSGRLYYDVNNGSAPPTLLYPEDMFHLHGLGFDGRVGYSVISYAARSIGLGMAAEEFGSAFFANGANPGGVLEHPAELSDNAYKHLTESLDKRHAGPENANRPMILEEGMKFTSITIPQKDAQFLESREFNVTDIARWYGVPPHKLMDLSHATFSNIEHLAIESVQDALMPWIVSLELESRIKLFNPRTRRRLQTKINVNGLLRGDLASRSAFYKEMSNLGVYSINDILEKEDENPIGPDGDKRLVQINQTTLEKIGEDIDPARPIEDDPVGRPDQLPAPDDDQDVEDVANLIFLREGHRLKEALRNYAGDEDAFEKWINRFVPQHRQYIEDHTRNLVMTDAFIDKHIETLRAEFWKAHLTGDSNYSAEQLVDEIKKAMI